VEAEALMSVLRANVEFAKRILADRVGNEYVYGGNWNPFNLDVGTDCSGLVVDILDAAINGTAMAWTRHGMSTESWRPIEVGQRGTIFGTICVASPADFPADAAVKIAIHHGPGGGANSHTWCEVDGVRGESNGSDGCVTGNRARSVYDTSYANDWHYLPGPITGSVTDPVPPIPALSQQDKYALQIIAEGRRRNVTPRGIQIALSVALVESSLQMYANSNVPESLNIPHDKVGSDHDSVGLFQQRCPMWGPAAVLMDPAQSAGLFYDRLVKLDYNNPARLPGDYAADVQRPAAEYRGRYQERMGDAINLYNRLSTIDVPTAGDDMAQVPQEQWDRVYQELTKKFPSRSPLRHLGEGLVDTMAGMVLNTDGSVHVEICRILAGYGHPPTLELLREVAGADPLEYPDRQDDAKMAQAILADVTKAPVSFAPVDTTPAVVPRQAQPQVVVYRDAPSTSGNSSTGQLLGQLFDALEAVKTAQVDLGPQGKASIDSLISVLQPATGAAS
jgi:hypothetical protein